MTTDTVAHTEVDSAEQEQDDAAPASRVRITQNSTTTGTRKRRVDLDMGGYRYSARCPKLVVWSDMAGIIADQAHSRADRRRNGDTERADSERITTDRLRITAAMQHFLRGCLSAADWDAIEGDLRDPDDDLDVPDLWGAGLRLIVEFRPDMEADMKTIGMRMPAELATLEKQIDPDTGLLRQPDESAAAPRTARPAKAGRKR
jgi:hypothetical protein